MAYQISSGDISPDALYLVVGTQSVIYNSINYDTGKTFKGIRGITNFIYSGNGNQEVNEVLEFTGSALEYSEHSIDQPVYGDSTFVYGMSIEFALNDNEKLVNEITKIQGFTLELLDYPFYSFEITEISL